MAVNDVRVHAYEGNHPGRPWAGQLHGPASATGEEMVAAMDAVGVDAAIIVSTFNLYRYDPMRSWSMPSIRRDSGSLSRSIPPIPLWMRSWRTGPKRREQLGSG